MISDPRAAGIAPAQHEEGYFRPENRWTPAMGDGSAGLPTNRGQGTTNRGHTSHKSIWRVHPGLHWHRPTRGPSPMPTELLAAALFWCMVQGCIWNGSADFDPGPGWRDFRCLLVTQILRQWYELHCRGIGRSERDPGGQQNECAMACAVQDVSHCRFTSHVSTSDTYLWHLCISISQIKQNWFWIIILQSIN